MTKALPEPGYYRAGDNDVLVVDPLTISPTGRIRTKDGNDANWRPAVAFHPAFEPGDLSVLSADVFDHRFHPITREEALARVQAAELLRDKQAGDEVRAAEAEEAGETVDAEALAEGPTASASAPE